MTEKQIENKKLSEQLRAKTIEYSSLASKIETYKGEIENLNSNLAEMTEAWRESEKNNSNTRNSLLHLENNMKLEMAKFKSQEDELTSLKKQLSDKNI